MATDFDEEEPEYYDFGQGRVYGNPFVKNCINEHLENKDRMARRCYDGFDFDVLEIEMTHDLLRRCTFTQERALEHLKHDLRLYEMDDLLKPPKFLFKRDKDMAKALDFHGTRLDWQMYWTEKNAHDTCDQFLGHLETVEPEKRDKMVAACKRGVTAALIDANRCIVKKAQAGKISA